MGYSLQEKDFKSLLAEEVGQFLCPKYSLFLSIRL